MDDTTYSTEQLLQMACDVLEFYADPETYFAVGFFPDPPCGDFVNDLSDDYDHPDMTGPRPGKRARDLLNKISWANLDKELR